MQPSEASKNVAIITSVIRRRPNASESAPCQSVMIAKGSIYAVSVCCTMTGEAPKCWPISRKEGR